MVGRESSSDHHFLTNVPRRNRGRYRVPDSGAANSKGLAQGRDR